MAGDVDKGREKVEFSGRGFSENRSGSRKSAFPPGKKIKYTGETIRFLVLVILSALIVISALQVVLTSIRS